MKAVVIVDSQNKPVEHTVASTESAAWNKASESSGLNASKLQALKFRAVAVDVTIPDPPKDPAAAPAAGAKKHKG
jgi:hypothetical protein